MRSPGSLVRRTGLAAPDGPAEPRGSTPLPGVLARTALGLLLLVLLAPSPGPPAGTGIDPSYGWGVGALAAAGAEHGRDVAFPFGPLGWLLQPRSPGLRLALAAWWALHLLWGAALLALLRRPVGGLAAAGFAALVLLSRQIGHMPEGQLLLVLATFIALALLDPGRPGGLAAALAGALAPVLALVRLSLGAEALAMVAVLAALSLARAERRRRALAAVAGLLIATAVLVPLAFPSVRDALHWLAAQAELARGFGTAMSLPGPRGSLAAGLLALAFFALLLLRAIRTRSAARDLWLTSLPAVLLAFKHGFVRQDGHVLALFATLLGLMALGLLAGGGEREARATLAAALAVLALGLPSALAYLTQDRTALDLALGRQAAANLRLLVDIDGFERQVARRSRRRLAASRLPRPFVLEARRRNLTADAVPWELSLLAANGLRWRPSPTLQLYTAYTRELDAWSARHFAGEKAPDLLLAGYDALDGRNMLWDTPETWRAILTHYGALAARPRPDLLALVRRRVPARWSVQPLGEARIGSGTWAAVPAAPAGWTFAHLELPLTIAGRLATALLRLPPIEAELAFRDGGKARYRLVPGTAAGGLLVSPTPETLDHLEAMFRGGNAGRQAVRLRLAGPGAAYVSREARVAFRSWTLR